MQTLCICLYEHKGRLDELECHIPESMYANSLASKEEQEKEGGGR